MIEKIKKKFFFFNLTSLLRGNSSSLFCLFIFYFFFTFSSLVDSSHLTKVVQSFSSKNSNYKNKWVGKIRNK